MDYAMIDLDHTLCESEWRDYLLKAARGDCAGLHKMTEEEWDEYHYASANDECNILVRSMIRVFQMANMKVILCTARGEKYRDVTIGWLKHHDIDYDYLCMRPYDAEKVKSAKLKPAMISTLFNWISKHTPHDDHELRVVVDDHPEVIEAFSKWDGVLCMQVKQPASAARVSPGIMGKIRNEVQGT